ncbi:MAG: lytic murein transglycosylase [Parahaliea sp.]
MPCSIYRSAGFFLFLASCALPALASGDFVSCRNQLAERARTEGISQTTVDTIMPTLKEQKRAVAADRQQPEFVTTFADYVSKRVTPTRVDRGRELLAQHRTFLDEVQARTGVPGHYLLAFWGLETNYGGYMGNMPTLDSLATLACDPRRSEFFATEFINALRLLERESLTPQEMTGSWAGAVGHTQFMPSSYLSYAIDGDGDGRINLWTSERDALASGANFLRALGWQADLRWGRQVSLAKGFEYSLSGTGRPAALTDWAARGVRLLDGSPLPAGNIQATLLLPSGYLGPAFLVYDNFDVIMRWNRSTSYALSVGLLAHRIAGAAPGNYTRQNAPLVSISELKKAQQALLDKGFNPGKPDGILGSRTREALRAYQIKNGLISDGYPGQQTLHQLLNTTGKQTKNRG